MCGRLDERRAKERRIYSMCGRAIHIYVCPQNGSRCIRRAISSTGCSAAPRSASEPLTLFRLKPVWPPCTCPRMYGCVPGAALSGKLDLVNQRAVQQRKLGTGRTTVMSQHTMVATKAQWEWKHGTITTSTVRTRAASGTASSVRRTVRTNSPSVKSSTPATSMNTTTCSRLYLQRKPSHSQLKRTTMLTLAFLRPTMLGTLATRATSVAHLMDRSMRLCSQDGVAPRVSSGSQRKGRITLLLIRQAI